MHLHIGKNNVIGRAIIRNGAAKVVSSNEFLDMTKDQLSRYTNVSISAFNPCLKKHVLKREDPVIDFMKKNIGRDIHIIYISTSRVFDQPVSVTHRIYVNNKNSIRNSLEKFYKNFSCLHLPNIVPIVEEDSSDFVDQFLNNLDKKLVFFDCDEQSYWNLIDPDELGKFILSLGGPVGDISVMCENNLYVRDLIEFAKRIFPLSDLKLKIGLKRKSYPGTLPNSSKAVYLKSTKIDWLLKRREMMGKL